MKIKKIVRRNKKAVSPMIGYILLISAAIFMSVIVYAWLKTYVPRAALECPETTSIFIESYTCIPNNQLNITIRNNGNFNVAGYFIRISNKTGQTLATVDLSSKLQSEFEGITIGNSVLFSKNDPGNSFTPNDETTNVFDITGTGTINFIELTPIRIEEADNRDRTASCGNAKIKEEISC